MKTNITRAKLKNGEPAIGTWLTLPDPTAARLMARTGWDWLTVDMEHTPVNLETAALSFAQIAAEDVTPLVRVPSGSPETIKRVLDSGAWGIVVPMVNSAGEAEAVVRAARYQPVGKRSIGGQLHAANFDTDPATYYAQANDQILVVVMIEHAAAVRNVEAIARVPGIDAFFIGPNDLLNSLGHRPAFDSDDADFVQALDRVLRAAQASGIAAGIHALDAAAARRRLDQGFRFIAVGSEAGMMLAKAREILEGLDRKPGKGVARY